MGVDSHTVLLVEDDLPTAAQMKELLSVLGYQCVHAETQEQAIALVDQGGFCFALLDLEIKRNADSIEGHVEAGQAVLDAIRSRYGERNKRRVHWLPVLILSGHAKHTEIIIEMMRRGADDCVGKRSKDRATLPAKIKQCLERSEREEHANCATATARAGRTADAPTSRGVLTIVGRQSGQRNVVTVSEKQATLPNSSFIVLLHLVAARRAGAGPIHKRDLGATEEQNYKGISRLQADLKAYLPSELLIYENDGHGKYRLHPAIEVGDVDCAALAKHEEARVRQLAACIAASTVPPAAGAGRRPRRAPGAVRP